MQATHCLTVMSCSSSAVACLGLLWHVACLGVIWHVACLGLIWHVAYSGKYVVAETRKEKKGLCCYAS